MFLYTLTAHYAQEDIVQREITTNKKGYGKDTRKCTANRIRGDRGGL